MEEQDGRQPTGPVPVGRNADPGEQGVLFSDGIVSQDRSALGYRGTTACAAAAITYRQLDYWARTELVEPSIRTGSGSGTPRLYSFRDILVLKLVKRLLDTGVSLQNIRRAISQLQHHGVGDLAGITLMSDGTTVYECRSPEEVVDLLAGGQGVFGIAVSTAYREVAGELAHLPSEPAGQIEPGEPIPVAAPDELAARRARRIG